MGIRGSRFEGNTARTQEVARMYLARWEHGTMTVDSGSRMRMEEEYTECVQQLLARADLTIAMVVPRRFDLVCARHTTCYAVNGVPCFSISLQGERPEIPRAWQP